MRNVSANSTCGDIRSPESILLAKERARFRDEVLTAALAAVASDYLRLVIHARFNLGWTHEQVAQEFGIGLTTAWRAEARALEMIRQQLAKKGVTQLRDIL